MGWKIVSVGLLGWALPQAAAAQVIWQSNFQALPEGAYTLEQGKVDFGNPSYIKIPDGRARIKLDPELGRKVLEVKYPKGCHNPGMCAMQGKVHFPGQERAWVKFRMKFETGFDFKKGGKIPGLCGAQCNGGCIDVSGKDGWSARMMWRSGGELVQYVYHPDNHNGCGQDMSWGRAAVPGRWMTFKHQVVMNSVAANGGTGTRNGILRTWMDGTLVLNKTAMRFRDIASIQIDQLYFSTFHGGNDASWAPARDVYASFADFVISTVDPDSLPGGSTRLGGEPSGREGLLAFGTPGALEVRHGGEESVRALLYDVSGRKRGDLGDLGPGGVKRLSGLAPGLYYLRWSGRAGRGNRPVTVF